MSARVRGFLSAVLGVVFSISSAAQDVPEQIKPGADQQLVLQLHATGDQVYTCKEDIGGYLWTLKAPDAQLFDKSGKAVGKHFAGPSWEMNDGSRVKGEVAASAPSPEKDAIPWLLVNVIGHEGKGVLSPVTKIQRINTKGGKAPAKGCDEAHETNEVRMPYSADYLFYAPK